MKSASKTGKRRTNPAAMLAGHPPIDSPGAMFDATPIETTEYYGTMAAECLHMARHLLSSTRLTCPVLAHQLLIEVQNAIDWLKVALGHTIDAHASKAADAKFKVGCK